MTDNNIPKFVATPEWDHEYIEHFGSGDTPEEARQNLTAQPILDYAQTNDIEDGEPIEARIYTACTPQKAGLCEEGEDSDYTWGLFEHIDTCYIKLEEAKATEEA